MGRSHVLIEKVRIRLRKSEAKTSPLFKVPNELLLDLFT